MARTSINTSPPSLFLPNFTSSTNAYPQDHLTTSTIKTQASHTRTTKPKLHSNISKLHNGNMNPPNSFTMNPNTNARTGTDRPLVDGWFCTGTPTQAGCGSMGFENYTHCPNCGCAL